MLLGVVSDTHNRIKHVENIVKIAFELKKHIPDLKVAIAGMGPDSSKVEFKIQEKNLLKFLRSLVLYVLCQLKK